MSTRETSSEIDDAAAEWALRVDDAVLGADEQAELDRWLESDIRRVGAFVRARAVLAHAKRAKALGSEFDPASFERNEGDAGQIDHIADERPEAAVFSRRRMLIGASAVAATAAMAFVIPTRRASAQIYRTRRGETRLLPLADGSTVTLNTDSSIAVTVEAGRPTVQLERGEALFKVASAHRLPFFVEAGDTSLRAWHATFAVCRLDARPLQVKVCDGNVEVARNSRARRIRANRQVIMRADGSMIEQDVAADVLERELAWQQGMLSFEDTPLSQAAEQFARYSDRKIGIADPLVGTETVTGLYAANNPDGFARAVALGLNLRVQSTPGGVILAR